MRQPLRVLGTLIAVAAAAGGADGPDLSGQFLPAAPAGKEWNLVWHDEFDGRRIDPAKWEVLGDWKRRDGWWWKADSYLDGNGLLVLRTAKVGERFTCGAVRSRGKFEHRFGYWECRCEFPAEPGHWPAFWLFSAGVGKVGNDGRDGTEIDIMEKPWRNDDVQHALHWDGYGKDHKSVGKKVAAPGMMKGWHTFGLHWKPDEYVFYIDGKESWRTSAGGVSQVPAYVKLTEEIGTWGGDIARAKLPDRFLVDYVRVFDLTDAKGAETVAATKAITVEVRAGRHDRAAVPVTLPLPKALAGQEHFALTRQDRNRSVPVQLAPGKTPAVVWMLDEPLKAGQTRRYELKAAIPLPKILGPPAVRVEDDGRGLNVSVDGKAVLTYNHAVVPSPDPKAPYYKRSGYLHPVRNPRGEVLTDDFAPDHAHQHGIMFPWTQCTFEGKPAEFWNQKLLLGTVEHAGLDGLGGGDVLGHFTATLRHVALKAPGGPKAALTETWVVRVYRRTDGFLFDIDSTQRCAADSPLTIEKYHYGGMAVRCLRDWIDKGDFLTSDGKTRADGNHTRPKWVDVHGKVAGRPTGIVAFCHPANFRAPQPVRLHPDKPYFCFAPMVLGEFRIEPGKPYVSRYRFLVHDGNLDPAAAEALWADYADPVEAVVVE